METGHETDKSDGEPCDFKIRTAGGEINAHKWILCEHSEFFATCIQGVKNATELLLDDIEVAPGIIEKLVEFMYTKTLEWTGNQEKEELLDAARVLGIQQAVDCLMAKTMSTEPPVEISLVEEECKEEEEQEEGSMLIVNDDNDAFDMGMVGHVMEVSPDEQIVETETNDLQETSPASSLSQLNLDLYKEESKKVVPPKPVEKPYVKAPVSGTPSKVVVRVLGLDDFQMGKVKDSSKVRTAPAGNTTVNTPKVSTVTAAPEDTVVKSTDSEVTNEFVVTKTDSEKTDNESSESKGFKKPQVPPETLQYLQNIKEKAVEKTKRVYSKPTSGPSILVKYRDHQELGWYICPWEGCQFRTRHTKNVYIHERTHTGEKPYCCKTCGKCFISNKHLTIHEKIHSDDRPFVCEICDKRLRTQKHLDRHNLVHTGEKPYKCAYDGCGAAFKDRVNWKKHIALVHEGQRPYECDHPGCAYAAYDESSLKRHQRRHLDLAQRDSEMCTICGKRLYGARSIKSHMLIHEGQEHACPYCDYKTVFKQALVAHCMRKHNKDLEGNPVQRNFRCHLCAFSTFWHHDLSFHLAKHTGARPFKCPICNYSTALKGSLQKHMRLHTGETPFSCTLCNKAYTNQSALARHKRTHTGEKPHICDLCGKRYADAKTLRTHHFSHINWKPYMCSICKYSCIKKDALLLHLRKAHGHTDIPDELQSKPPSRVVMRITSGQTADDILSNIAPHGKGERQLFMQRKLGIGTAGDEATQFMIIHEEDMQEGIVMEDNFADVQTMMVKPDDLETIQLQLPASSHVFSPQHQFIPTMTDMQHLAPGDLEAQGQGIMILHTDPQNLIEHGAGIPTNEVVQMHEFPTIDTVPPSENIDTNLVKDENYVNSVLMEEEILDQEMITDLESGLEDVEGEAGTICPINTAAENEHQFIEPHVELPTDDPANAPYILHIPEGQLTMQPNATMQLEPIGNGEFMIRLVNPDQNVYAPVYSESLM